METKFFKLFHVLHPVRKQAYNLKLVRKWKIYDAFYLSLLKQNNIKKKCVNENVTQLKFEANDNKDYKIEII